MEEIQKFLTGFEKIRWKKVEIKDLSIFSLKYILLSTAPLFVILIVSLLTFDFSKPFDFYFLIIVIIIFTIGLIAMINMLFRADKKKMNSLNLTRNQLKKYEKMWILTNKRWIQKNIDINRELYPDAKRNGTVWDTPYQIYGGASSDNYPLVTMFIQSRDRMGIADLLKSKFVKLFQSFNSFNCLLKIKRN